VSSVGSGFGLLGGPVTSSGSLSVNTSAVQQRVTGSCTAGNYLRAVAQDGTVTCQADADTNSGGTVTSVGSGFGLLGGPVTSSGSLSVNTSAIQQRVASSCAAGSSIRSIAQDGSVTCETDDDTNSGGTVTSVGSGDGLAGGPITGSGTLTLMDCAANQVLKRNGGDTVWACAADQDTTYSAGAGLALSGTAFSLGTTGCVAGEVWKWNGTAWNCDPDADTNSGGTVTSVGSGAGLTGGPVTGSGTLSIASGGVTSAMLLDGAVGSADINAAQVQQRISGTCSVGSYVRAVAQDGTVTCGTDADTLAALGCSTSQVAKWNGTAWACAADLDTNSGGTVSSVGTGLGLQGGPITGSGTVDLRLYGTGGLSKALGAGSNELGIAASGVTSGMLLDGAVATADLANGAVTGAKTDAATVQARVSGTCAAGNYVRAVAQDGTVTCGADANAGGDVTGVTAGSGLSGGGLSGDVTLTVDTASIQNRVSGTCAAGSSIRVVNADGSVTCEADDSAVYTGTSPIVVTGTDIALSTDGCDKEFVLKFDGSTWVCDMDANSGGTVTSVASGAGLTGGPVTGSGTLSIASGGVTSAMLADNTVASADIDQSQVQKRVDSSCFAGQSMRVINQDGSVTCQSFVTSITAGGGLTGGTITGAGTVSLATVACGYGALVTGAGASGLTCTADGSWQWRTIPRTNTVITVDDPANAVGSYTSTTIGNDGFPVISHYDSSSGALRVVICGNVMCNLATVRIIDDPANDVGRYTSVAIGTDGFPVISYRDATALALKVAKCGNAACSAGNTITTVDDPANNVGYYTSIAIGTDGFPVISYLDSTADALKVAKCGNAACSAGNTLTTVDDPANSVGYFTSIAIGTDGFPVISYLDNTADALKVAKCGNAACSAGNTITTVDDPANSVGEYTSIAIGTDGFPVISYRDATALALKVAKCGNAACSAGNTLTTVDDPANNVGEYTSIAIGTDGFPVISYYDLTAGSLKVAKCGNAACSAGNTITTVDDPANNVGEYTSITIGTDGLAFISYYDATAGALKVVHLANEFGVNNWWRR
jgi:hypothetical protein